MTHATRVLLAAASLASMMVGLPSSAVQPAVHDGLFAVGANAQTDTRGAPPAGQRTAITEAAWWAFRGTGGHRTHYPRPGWSVRQGQRMARKRRNQARARRAARGG